MGNRLYIGNVSYDTTEETLRQVFSEDGRIVKKIMMIIDRETGRPRGFAFAIMGSDSDAHKAIQSLDGREVNGRSLRVNEAKEKENNGPSGYIRGPEVIKANFTRNEPAPAPAPAPVPSEEFPDLIPKNTGRPARDFGPPRFAGSGNWDKKKPKRRNEGDY